MAACHVSHVGRSRKVTVRRPPTLFTYKIPNLIVIYSGRLTDVYSQKVFKQVIVFEHNKSKAIPALYNENMCNVLVAALFSFTSSDPAIHVTIKHPLMEEFFLSNKNGSVN